MAATYTALISLQNTIMLEQRPRYHPFRRISIDDGGLIQDLQARLSFWARFLEEGKDLGAQRLKRMADAAYAAEDAIESYVVDQVAPTGGTCTAELRQVLRNVIQDMDSICKQMKLAHQIGENSPCAAGPSTSAPPHDGKGESKDRHPTTGSSAFVGCSTGDKSTMVGFEDERNQATHNLTWGNRCRAAVPIVGMGGSGKTTLAKNIYGDMCIVGYFEFRVWVTVSQNCNVREILIGVLKDLGDEDMLRKESDESLEVRVHKTLFERRYLIVLDDIWSIDDWEKIQRFFPDDREGSRIMLTTRDSTLAEHVSTSPIRMNYLDEDKGWKLLCEKVFGPEVTCPTELEDVGKEIIGNCRGLPLSIVIIGGLLARSKDIEHWKLIAQLSSFAVHLDPEERCLEILSLSYNHLPIYVKPCFLYLGIFPEDHVILVSELINLWIGEGLLTPREGKSLEEIAEECLRCLGGGNLITIHNLCSSGEKYCKIHDLLRELCLKEAQKEKFLHIVMPHIPDDPQVMVRARRVIILPHLLSMEEYSHMIHTLLSKSRPRSLIVYNCKGLSSVLGSPIFKLLRVFLVIGGGFKTKAAGDHACLSTRLLNLVNLRYLTCSIDSKFTNTLASSIGLLGNLQTLVVRNFIKYVRVPNGIWNLPQLRHVEFDVISLLEQPVSEQEQRNLIVLKNLQTTKRLLNFSFEEGILEKISHVKELDIWYTTHHWERKEAWADYNLQNLNRITELESFKCTFYPPAEDCYDLLTVFPCSLKKLSLSGCNLLWEDMSMISSLPLLEMLELRNDSFVGPEWSPEEEKFPCLRYLYMRCLNLKTWNAENANFPCLKHLVLYDLRELAEIPSEIGEIPTLELIEMDYCPDSLVRTAINILQEQQDFGEDGLRVKVTPGVHNELSFDEMEIENILVDTKRREYYMQDVLKSYIKRSGLDALGINPEDDPGDHNKLSFDETEVKNMLVDKKHREYDYMLDVLVSYMKRLGLDALGKEPEDDPDELMVQSSKQGSNDSDSSASEQDWDPMEDDHKQQAFLFSKCWMHMYFLTEYR